MLLDTAVGAPEHFTWIRPSKRHNTFLNIPMAPHPSIGKEMRRAASAAGADNEYGKHKRRGDRKLF